MLAHFYLVPAMVLLALAIGLRIIAATADVDKDSVPVIQGAAIMAEVAAFACMWATLAIL